MSLKLDLLAVLLLVGLEPPTQAHDIYSHLTDSNGKSCCDEKDCRPVPYRVTPAGVQMFIDGEWIVVPIKRHSEVDPHCLTLNVTE
jgi:hypothetical protein